jgi:hypothetical protein
MRCNLRLKDFDLGRIIGAQGKTDRLGAWAGDELDAITERNRELLPYDFGPQIGRKCVARNRQLANSPAS